MSEYIEREAVKLCIFEYGVRRRNNPSISSACENLERRMNYIPAADVRPVVRGKWVPLIRYLENTVVGWECSVCGFGIDISEDGFNYCPKCGADLRECDT